MHTPKSFSEPLLHIVNILLSKKKTLSDKIQNG